MLGYRRKLVSLELIRDHLDDRHTELEIDFQADDTYLLREGISLEMRKLEAI